MPGTFLCVSPCVGISYIHEMCVCVCVRNHPLLREQLTLSSARLGSSHWSVWFFGTWNCQALPCWQMGCVPTTTAVISLGFSLVSSTWSPVSNIHWLLSFSLLWTASSYTFFLYLDFSVQSFALSNWFVGLFIYSEYKALFWLCVANFLSRPVTSLFYFVYSIVWCT